MSEEGWPIAATYYQCSETTQPFQPYHWYDGTEQDPLVVATVHNHVVGSVGTVPVQDRACGVDCGGPNGGGGGGRRARLLCQVD
jgi:hypothetical protein